jgi:hypothetical protein
VRELILLRTEQAWFRTELGREESQRLRDLEALEPAGGEFDAWVRERELDGGGAVLTVPERREKVRWLAEYLAEYEGECLKQIEALRGAQDLDGKGSQRLEGLLYERDVADEISRELWPAAKPPLVGDGPRGEDENESVRCARCRQLNFRDSEEKSNLVGVCARCRAKDAAEARKQRERRESWVGRLLSSI